MNHFAHARVAAAHSEGPLLALGAMLPDFASMLRERLCEPAHPTLRAGVRLHHASDAVFHAAPEFVCAWRAAGARLRELGVARGPSRAAAHVGIELCVDAGLAGEPDAARHYSAALGAATRPELLVSISWRGGDAAMARWHSLHERLSLHGTPQPDTTPESLAARVARALATRPRLALAEAEHEPVARWLTESRVELCSLARPLLHRVVEATRFGYAASIAFDPKQ